jgi:hypothetical protein
MHIYPSQETQLFADICRSLQWEVSSGCWDCLTCVETARDLISSCFFNIRTERGFSEHFYTHAHHIYGPMNAFTVSWAISNISGNKVLASYICITYRSILIFYNINRYYLAQSKNNNDKTTHTLRWENQHSTKNLQTL